VTESKLSGIIPVPVVRVSQLKNNTSFSTRIAQILVEQSFSIDKNSFEYTVLNVQSGWKVEVVSKSLWAIV